MAKFRRLFRLLLRPKAESGQGGEVDAGRDDGRHTRFAQSDHDDILNHEDEDDDGGEEVILDLSSSQKGPCPSCHDLKPNWGDDELLVVKFRPIIEFASSRKRCLSCNVIMSSLEREVGNKAIGRSSDMGISLLGGTGLSVVLSRKAGQSRGVDVAKLELYTVGESCQSWNAIQRKEHVSPDPTAGALVQKVSNWVSECHETHETCRPKSPPGGLWAPTRLIFVGSGTAAENEIQLRHQPEFVGPQGPPRYIALSHCWGKVALLTTTTGTIRDRAQGIQWESLSKTFQDAITFTRLLGISFIWIDSLCIIQDDEADWVKEAAQMADIYERSYVTLSALSAVDGRDGMFHPRRPPVRTTISGSGHPDNGVTIFGRRQTNHEAFLKQSSGFGRIEFPLNARGWTLQESLLSSRTVYFGSDEVLFQCGQENLCECSLGGVIHRNAEDDDKVVSPKALKYGYHQTILGNGHAENSGKNPAVMWRDIVSRFTSRELTYARDTLPALRGLAVRFDSLGVLGRYIAGLWEGQLPGALLWYTLYVGERPDLRQPQPTWSWISVTGGGAILWHTVPTTDSFPVVVKSVHCSWATSDPMGMVNGGELVLTAPVLEVRLRKASRTKNLENWKTRYSIVMKNPGGGEEVLPLPASDLDVSLERKGDDAVSDGKMLYCMLISVETDYYEELYRCRGLYLTQSKEGYRRIGCFAWFAAENWAWITGLRQSDRRTVTIV